MTRWISCRARDRKHPLNRGLNGAGGTLLMLALTLGCAEHADAPAGADTAAAEAPTSAPAETFMDDFESGDTDRWEGEGPAVESDGFESGDTRRWQADEESDSEASPSPADGRG